MIKTSKNNINHANEYTIFKDVICDVSNIMCQGRVELSGFCMQLKLSVFEIECYNITVFYVIVIIATKKYKIEEKGNKKGMKACQYRKINETQRKVVREGRLDKKIQFK